MRRGDVCLLCWEPVELAPRILGVEETEIGEQPELFVTRQLAAIFDRRRVDGDESAAEGWVSTSPRKNEAGYIADLVLFYPRITREGGTQFWFHGLRNAFITVAECELLLPRSLTKRLVNHTRPLDVTEGYTADWTVTQLRELAQRIADRIDELSLPPPMDTSSAFNSGNHHGFTAALSARRFAAYPAPGGRSGRNGGFWPAQTGPGKACKGRTIPRSRISDDSG